MLVWLVPQGRMLEWMRTAWEGSDVRRQDRGGLSGVQSDTDDSGMVSQPPDELLTEPKLRPQHAIELRLLRRMLG